MRPRLSLLLLLATCARPAPTSPPAAEFLLVAGDSTYWVTNGANGPRVRGSPLMLARYGGRFHELYVADDDRSYYDALLVGQLVYSRDLITDDSTAVFADTLVDRIANAYAAAHADEQPLGPDDPVADHPMVAATSDVTLLDVYGPFLSLEYHADTRIRPRPGYHATWRSVVDLRAGAPVALASLLGPDRAARTIAGARRRYRGLVDSARAGEGDFGDAVDLALSEVRFDEHSFALADRDGEPAIVFAGVVAGRHDEVGTLPLPAIPIDSQAWWAEVRPTLPTNRSGDRVRWDRPGYAVVARVDTTDSLADVTIVDSTAHREWAVGRVHTPLRRVYWLDRPAIDSTTRRALRRAFNEAVLYDDNVRIAARHAPSAGSSGVPSPAAAALFHPAADRRVELPPSRSHLPPPAARRSERRRPAQP